MSTEQDSLDHKPSSSTSDSRGSATAASQGRNVPGLTSGKSQISTETVSDDRLAVPPGSPLASLDNRKRRQISELENQGSRKRRQIRELKGEVGDLDAEISKQQGELISELRAKLLEKDNEIERLTNLNQRLTNRELERRRQVEEFLQQFREPLHLSGMSEEDEAGESNHECTAATRDPTAAAIESTTASHVGIQEQAKTAKVNPFRKSGPAFEQAKTSTKAWDVVMSEFEEQTRAEGIPFRKPGLVFEDAEISNKIWGDIEAGPDGMPPGPGHMISKYED